MKLTFKQAFKLAAGLTLGYEVVVYLAHLFFATMRHWDFFYNYFISN